MRFAYLPPTYLIVVVDVLRLSTLHRISFFGSLSTSRLSFPDPTNPISKNYPYLSLLAK